jgi:hypothetical protein
MRILLKYIVLLFLIISNSQVQAYPQASKWFTQGPGNKVTLYVDFFMSSTCPHCHKADDFFSSIESKAPWLKIKRHVINTDIKALKYFDSQLQDLGSTSFAVPAFMFCDTHWVGFLDAQTSGKTLIKAMGYCYQQILKEGRLSAETIAILKSQAGANQYEMVTAEPKSPLYLIPLAGMFDAFSPCALFGFLGFLGFLWLVPNQKRSQYTVGFSFIIPFAMVRLIQLISLEQFYRLSELMRWPGAVVGGLLILLLIRCARQLIAVKTIPEPRYIMILSMFTAGMIALYQQSCDFNVGLITQQWLDNQPAHEQTSLLYYGLYFICYMIPLSIILLIVSWLSRKEKYAHHALKFTIIGAVLLAGIALLLLINPTWLSSIYLSYGLLLLACVIGYGLKSIRRRREQK